MEAAPSHVTSIALGPLSISLDADDNATLFTFAIISIVVHSVLAVPLSSVVWISSVVLFGVVKGFTIALLTTTFGCFISFRLARSCRSFILRMLGDHASTWHAIDSALSQEKWKIPLLLRATPVMPLVPANFMLALTSVDEWTYLWTSFVGIIPASIPYAYAAVVGEQVLTDFPPTDPVLLSVSLVGLLATLYVVYKIGAIATHELSRLGVGSSPPPKAGAASTDPAAHVDLEATTTTTSGRAADGKDMRICL